MTIAHLFAGEPGRGPRRGRAGAGPGRGCRRRRPAGLGADAAGPRLPASAATTGAPIALFGEAIETLAGDLVRERLGQAVPPSLYARSIAAICLAELGDFAEAERLGTEAAALRPRRSTCRSASRWPAWRSVTPRSCRAADRGRDRDARAGARDHRGARHPDLVAVGGGAARLRAGPRGTHGRRTALLERALERAPSRCRSSSATRSGSPGWPTRICSPGASTRRAGGRRGARPEPPSRRARLRGLGAVGPRPRSTRRAGGRDVGGVAYGDALSLATELGWRPGRALPRAMRPLVAPLRRCPLAGSAREAGAARRARRAALPPQSCAVKQPAPGRGRARPHLRPLGRRRHHAEQLLKVRVRHAALDERVALGGQHGGLDLAPLGRAERAARGSARSCRRRARPAVWSRPSTAPTSSMRSSMAASVSRPGSWPEKARSVSRWSMRACCDSSSQWRLEDVPGERVERLVVLEAGEIVQLGQPLDGRGEQQHGAGVLAEHQRGRRRRRRPRAARAGSRSRRPPAARTSRKRFMCLTSSAAKLVRASKASRLSISKSRASVTIFGAMNSST